MTTQQAPSPEPLTELRLPGEVKQAVNEAYVPGNQAIIVAYTDEHGEPNATFRGSVIALSDTQLAFWARNADGGTVGAAERGAVFVLLHREPGEVNGPSRAAVTFRGRSRLARDEAERRTIYDTIVQRERDGDKDYNGVGIVVELDSVIGQVHGIRMRMTR
jgi:hypothetical protein